MFRQALLIVWLRFAAVRRRIIFLALVAAAALTASAHAQTADFPDVAGRAVVVANGATGEIVYERDADARLAPASLTKLMTAIVALEHARPSERVRVTSAASSVGESSIRLRPGERLPVRDLLAAMLIQSANDAAYALAAHVGEGDVRAFVRLMNAKSRELGLRQTRWVRPDGLDTPGHVSSARDLLVLAREAMRRPLVRALVRRRGGRIAGGRSLFAWNDLLGRFPGLFGVKTGHTEKAGWCQVGAARRDGVTVYAVVLGSPSRARRNADLAELLEWGFGQYVRARVVEASRAYATAALPYSDERLPLSPATEARAVVRLGRPLVEQVVAPAVVDLPVSRGERVGEVRVLEGKRVVARRPLVATRAAGEAGFGQRAAWYAGRALEEAGGLLEGVFGAIR